MKENSIEEDIKIALDKFSDNKDIDSAILIVEKFILGNYILRGGRKNIVKDSLRYILSDYKRALKEAERYKNMYKAEHEIHLVRNEQLDRKENAVTKCNELIIENAKLKEENQYNKLLLDLNNNFTIDKKTGNYKWNVIEIQKIKDKIEKIDEEKLGFSEDEWYLESEIKGYAIDKLQELLESEE